MPSPELNALFADKKPSGLFWLKEHASVAELSRLARGHQLSFFHLDGKKISGRDQFLNHAAVAMHFPEDTDRNWDAFYECLTDLDWVDSEGYVVYFDHTDSFATHHESQLETLIELFQDAVEYWKGEGQSMLVLLSGDHAPAFVPKV